ncbi:phosphoribosylanthranilate isomerase [Sphingobacterium hungaricum]|uniref:N-(5'-phosphoribosyl)anthranilate isomerase n=1 Tax=Sphingobacterium hungaricum TaxID=2082723 RepID=A0A928UUQ3_9SPHI|nr:phosphoribosylanthranilate isomerase [Sphingobacterium hungaricum]MBE8713273.1 N-(5'-phosphoribosyl)anthranilate isomerase [Sphingobacterium hungaricum]
MGKLKIKVCGMRNLDNIELLSKLPIDYMGLIFYEQSKRFVDQTVLLDNIDLGSIQRVGVFVDASLDDIKSKIRLYQLNAVQLHGVESPAFCQDLKSQNIQIIKAFGIDKNFNWEQLKDYQDDVDFFLFDTKTENHGGSGITFDWNILKNYTLQTPYFLSGGLTIDNIASAAKLDDLRLFGLDINSKFETEPGIKNIKLIEQALNIIQ